jgi:hypothetical protein
MEERFDKMLAVRHDGLDTRNGSTFEKRYHIKNRRVAGKE